MSSRSPSSLSRSSSVLSRNSSASILSPARTSCRHGSTGSRLNETLTRFSLSFQMLGTKKCYDCQTSTAAGALNLIKTMTQTVNNDKLDPNAVKQGAQLLFERVAGQRRKTEHGFKDQWKTFELAFATFCYRHVSETQLGDLCHNIWAKFGAGVDREFLRALAEAACRECQI
ncbi:hypothetical protein F4678DRAFT_57655 [Xylaria arbuscula]|nr:hypothetical protein F4678DRAFT_57655 [Xylaria arbuscula]